VPAAASPPVPVGSESPLDTSAGAAPPRELPARASQEGRAHLPLHRARPGSAGAPAEHANPSSSGPDLGLLAACLGLLAAAALLGLTGHRRKATRETRHRIARALQPMLGRR
jgi:hypothetical protein